MVSFIIASSFHDFLYQSEHDFLLPHLFLLYSFALKASEMCAFSSFDSCSELYMHDTTANLCAIEWCDSKD